MVQFFERLKRNNRREWFQPRKHLFDQHVKEPMLELIADINAEMIKFAPAFVTDPKRLCSEFIEIRVSARTRRRIRLTPPRHSRDARRSIWGTADSTSVCPTVNSTWRAEFIIRHRRRCWRCGRTSQNITRSFARFWLISGYAGCWASCKARNSRVRRRDSIQIIQPRTLLRRKIGFWIYISMRSWRRHRSSRARLWSGFER